MSHFKVLVFTKTDGATVDDLLRPYDENIRYKPYVQYTKEQAVAAVRKELEEYKNSVYAEYLADPEKYKENYGCRPEHIDYLENVFPLKLKWTDEECYEYKKQFFDDEMIAENGDLLSTYNPKSKWDWYTVGGRWKCSLPVFSGEYVDKAYAIDVDWDKVLPFAFVTPDGEWHEKGEMGWFSCVGHEKSEDDWKHEFTEFIKTLRSDVKVKVVDCHI